MNAIQTPSRRRAALAAAVCSLLLPAAAEPVVREYGKPSESETPVVRELAPPKLPPAAGILPFALGIFPAVELPAQDWDVALFRLNLFVGRHRDVYGLDVGAIGNETTGEFVGVQAAGLYNRVGWSEGAFQFAGILNRSAGDFAGLQAAVAANVADGTMTGFQCSLFNRAARLNGLQIGLFNFVEAGSGFQCGLFNRAARLNGLQIGLFNFVESGSGYQIGLWNSAQSLEGLQIGLGNYNADSSKPFCPVVNFAF